MGGQLYTNFLEHADSERADKEEGKAQEKKIIDGPKTSGLIQKLLEATANQSDNNNLKGAISTFINKENKTSDKITMGEFKTFMKE